MKGSGVRSKEAECHHEEEAGREVECCEEEIHHQEEACKES